MVNSNNPSQPQADVLDLQFQEAVTPADIEKLSQLAGEIWRAHYLPIIGAAQIEYMLARFQTPKAITEHIATGYRYYGVCQRQDMIAYFAIRPDAAEPSVHLSKLYVAQAWQRRGVGGQILAFLQHDCLQKGFDSIWLTVNRHNQQAIDFYTAHKFMPAGCLLQDIGAGFVMDDYKFIKTVCQ